MGGSRFKSHFLSLSGRRSAKIPQTQNGSLGLSRGVWYDCIGSFIASPVLRVVSRRSDTCAEHLAIAQIVEITGGDCTNGWKVPMT